MLHTFEQLGIGVATLFGGTLSFICLMVAGIVGTAICVGVLTQQIGTRIFAADENACVYNGFQAGAAFGVSFSLVGWFQIGASGAFYSLLGLWLTFLFLAFLIWCFTKSPQKTA